MLALVVVAVSAAFKAARERALTAHARDGAVPARQALVPWFLWMFVALVVVNSLGLVRADVRQGLSTLSRACLVLAIAALGMKTSFAYLARAAGDRSC